jgi:hypothetical protein
VPNRFEGGFSASGNPPAVGRHTHRRATPVNRSTGPRLERDWTSWPRRSGARGTWRRSRRGD